MSVVIPTRDRRAVIPRTLDSALGRREVDFEVVIVDDGSSDDTASYVASLADPRLRLVRHDGARGVAAARNTGVAVARGRWIALLDDDDVWAPTKLARQLAEASRANADVVYAAGIRVDDMLNPIDELGTWNPDVLLNEMMNANRIPACASSLMARRNLMLRVGPFDERLRHLSDWDMALRLVAAADCAACAEPLVAYVVRRDSASVGGRGPTRHVQDLAIMRRTHRELSRQLGVSLGGDDFWDWLFWGARVSGRRRFAARLYCLGALHQRRPSHLARAAASIVGLPIMRFGPELLEQAGSSPASPAWLADLQATPT